MKLPLIERARAWLPLLLPLLLLGGSYWLSQQVSAPDATPDAKKRHDVDYVVEKFSATTLDETGKPRYTLSADRIWHYPDDHSTHLQAPKLLSHDKDGSSTLTSAQTGKLANNGDEILLYDTVKMVHSKPAQGGETVFQSDFLHVFPKQDRAGTDQAVTLTTPHGVIRAVGMELDTRTHLVKLLSNVRATHDPIDR